MGSSLRFRFPLAVGAVLASFVAQAPAAEYIDKLANKYHAEQNNVIKKNGAATAQMVLDATNLGNIVVPQLTLAGDILANNFPGTGATQNGFFSTTPDGLADALQARDTNVGDTYLPFNVPNYDKAIKDMAYDIDNYGISAAALLKGGNQWVNVFGISTSVKPNLAGNFTVNGFYIKDPARNGLGSSRYLRNNAAGWQSYFVPTVNGGKYNGNFAFVADPDPNESTASAEPADGNTMISSSGAALSQATSDLAQLPELSGDPSFAGGAFSSSGELELTLPDTGKTDWLVPYDEGGQTTGIALIDPMTGDLDQALWDEGVLSGDSLTDVQTYLQSSGMASDNAVPEPSTFLLLAAGGALLALRAVVERRRLAAPIANRSRLARETAW
jgi:hypothetical protein